MRLLKEFLLHYDDGRRKSFYCLAVNLLDVRDVSAVLDRLADESKADSSVKAKAAAVNLFEEIARAKDISLKLRKKDKND
jgi:hypothetical protein